ncbi:hypothetical protein [Halochromatium roseum]|uniref:hypothetical protein n=1 Tax=Halochromatium roseum TaxID=391920 RepID=UPI001913BB5C|nr:hypothetical protein [Halochromatium roseum]MBK5941601.1 hypothetical protein [Halochromatium roseum]
MIKKFAIEPAALRRWEDFRYVTEKLGFSHGRVLAAFPKAWIKEFIEKQLVDAGEMERKRFIAKLQVIKQERMVNSGVPYCGDVPWSENALKHVNAFDRVIMADGSEECHRESTVQSIDVIDEAFFEVAREVECESTPRGLARPAEPLLSHASEAAIVDPYFRVDINSCLSVLVALAKSAVAGRRFEQFYVYTSTKFLPRDRGRAARSEFGRIAEIAGLSGARFEFRCVDPNRTEKAFHARYLLTGEGGLRYDKGFQASHGKELVDVSLLDRTLHLRLRDIYIAAQRPRFVVESWSWDF